MTEYEEANEIARQLRQKRLRSNPAVGKRIHINTGSALKRLLTTAEAAEALNRKVQTLRIWACNGSGPIAPVRIMGRLAWRVDDIEKLLNGE